jgi:hypothetical protein
MKFPIACLATLLLIANARAADNEPPEGFTLLFNGKDLSGWAPVNVAADTYTVRDGMIIISGVPTGYMRTEQMHENFVLECEWRHMKSGGNSGVFIWGDGVPAKGTGYTRGIEVQVLDEGFNPKGKNDWYTCQGDIFPIWGATMTPWGRISNGGKGPRSFPIEDRTKSSPEWNHYHIECNAGEIHESINGKEVTVAKDCVPRKGFIALESEGSECHFKNIYLKDLPTTNTPKEQTANPYTGFHAMFDGKSLAGWKTPDDVQPWWSVNGAHFLSKAGKDGHDKDLWSEKEYGDFELIADCRLANKPEKKPLQFVLPDGTDAKNDDGTRKLVEVLDGGDSGIFLRGSTKAQVNITCKTIGSGEIYGYRVDKDTPQAQRASFVPTERADNPPGKWNRFHITMKGDRLTVMLNDKIVIRDVQLRDIPVKGPIGLQHHGDAVEFTNIFVKELQP